MLYIYMKQGRMGFQSEEKTHLTTARWQHAEVLDERTGIIYDKTGYALLHIYPRRLVRLNCTCANGYADGLVRICRDGKYGLLNREGEVVIPVEYEVLTHHHGQFNIIGRNRKYGLINQLGEWVRPLRFDAVLRINQRGNDRLACIRRGRVEFL